MSSEQMSLETLLKIYLETKDKLREAETAELEIKFGTRNIQKITKNEYITCFQIVTEDLTLFEKITNFSTKHWIEHINDKINE